MPRAGPGGDERVAISRSLESPAAKGPIAPTVRAVSRRAVRAVCGQVVRAVSGRVLSALALAFCVGLAGCGSSTVRTGATSTGFRTTAPAAGSAGQSSSAKRSGGHGAHRRASLYPILLPAAQGSTGPGFTPVVQWRGRTAAWIARAPSGITLLSFDQRLLGLTLHSGTVDAGGSGWRYGPAVLGADRGRLVSAFNGGFKFSTGAGGYMSTGRVAVPLRSGLGSIVTYGDGQTDIGSWNREVPRPGMALQSVRQNLVLLIDHGSAASTIDCRDCWGATIGARPDVARSALGITADGRLVWAGGEDLSVAALTDALLASHVVRAVELDINPEWVAGYLYHHRSASASVPLGIVPVVPGQVGASGYFLQPYSRDFFAVLAR